MKSTTVPAQITTVEDKIAGNLSISQLLLLTLPIFASIFLYIGLPPFTKLAVYKLIMITMISCISATLAIRYKGKIFFAWAIIMLRYNLRPRYFIFDKNNGYLRNVPMGIVEQDTNELPETTQLPYLAPMFSLSTADAVMLEQLLEDQTIDLHFQPGKKGGIDVRFAEIER